MSDKLLVDIQEHVLTVTFNRPDKFNALDPESYFLLAQALYQLQHDDNLRVAVIRANGKHFTAGLGLDKWAPIFASGEAPQLPPKHIDPYGITGERMTTPVIIAVQGLCYTSGLELLLNTDIRIATQDARFAQLEVARGIYPCGGGTVRLPEEIGWANAQRYILTGDEFTQFILDDSKQTQHIVALGGLGSGGEGYAYIGPFFFPSIAGGGLLICSLLLLSNSIKNRQSASKVGNENAPTTNLHKFYLASITIALYLLGLAYLGFIYVTPIFIPVTSKILGSKSIKRDIIVGVILTALITIIFEHFLNVIVP